MKRVFCLILCMLSILFVASCGDNEDESSNDIGQLLNTPALSINENGTVSWEAIDGAIGYEYKINDGSIISVDKDTLKLQLLPGESVVVRAKADGSERLDSEWSEAIKNENAARLSKPVLKKTVVGAQILVSWDAIPNASGYEYRLNDSAETPLDATSFLVNAGDTFYVRANGDDVNYLDSAWAILE